MGEVCGKLLVTDGGTTFETGGHPWGLAIHGEEAGSGLLFSLH